MRMFSPLLTLGALLASVGTTAHTQTVDTRTGTAQFVSVQPQIGQSFTAPVGAQFLSSFSFFITSNAVGGAPVTFNAYLRAVSDGDAIGPVLFEQERASTACCVITEELFDTGAIPAFEGQQYVAFLIPQANSLATNRVSQGGVAFDSYAGGSGTYLELGCETSGVPCQLVPYAAGVDLEFVATFSGGATVPEPQMMWLLVPALIALVVLHNRRRKTSFSWRTPS